jgi:hypothetical protein
MHNRRIVVGVAAVAGMVFAGCVTFKNTPQQDYTWEWDATASARPAGLSR